MQFGWVDCAKKVEEPIDISPIAPITPAWNHMVRILFKPFDFKKWLLLGFCAFLATCGEGGGSGGGNDFSNLGNQGGSPYSEFDDAGNWISNNVGLVIFVIVGVFLLCLIVGLLVTWLSSRGKFMLLDGIVKNRGAVKEPWAEFKTEGNSLFWFRIIISILILVALLIILGIVGVIALPDIQDQTFRESGLAAIIVGVLLFIPYVLICVAIAFFISAFLVPTMYIKRVKAKEGARIAWDSLCKGHLGSAILLFLMMAVLGISVAFVAIAVTCATCCLASLPYVSSVVFLPITVFFTCYILCYIQQFGKEWQFLPATCCSCGYDLQGLKSSEDCPECGYSLKVKNGRKKKK